MKQGLLLGSLILCAFFCMRAGVDAQQQSSSQSQQNPPAQKPPVQNSQTSAPQSGTTNPPQVPKVTQQPSAPQPAPPETLRTVVIDPGHGGADTGSRGSTGLAEKDVVMDLAREIGAALRTVGFNVVMTRIADVDPSLDERAAVANAQRDAIFISLHVGSAGPAGTVRTYTYLFPSTAAILPLSPASFPGASSPVPAAPPPNFVSWREAQAPYVPQSRKLGDLIQVELAQKFKGSPEISANVPVAVLRSVTAPAVAVEISNISAGQQTLENMAPDLAAGIARAVTAYKSVYPPGGK